MDPQEPMLPTEPTSLGPCHFVRVVCTKNPGWFQIVMVSDGLDGDDDEIDLAIRQAMADQLNLIYGRNYWMEFTPDDLVVMPTTMQFWG